MSESLTSVIPTRGVRELIARRPLVSFLVLFLLSAWPLLWLVPLSAHGVLPWGKFPKYVAAAVTISMLSCALLVTWAQQGMVGIRHLVARVFRWRFSPLWWALALFALPGAALLCHLAFGYAIKTASLGTVVIASIWGMVKGLLAINLWEEAVWMGFFQTRLERRHNIFVAALITSVPFSGAHLPLQFTGQIEWTSVVGGFLVLCLAAVVFRLIGALILRGAGDSLLAVGIMHAMFNQVSQPGGFLTTLAPDADPGPSSVIALVLVLPLLFWCARGKLSRAYRLDVLEAGAVRERGDFTRSSSVELSASRNNSSR